MPGWRDCPPLFRHCVVAIFNKGVTGGGADGVVRAMKIARSQLAKQGYLAPPTGQQVLEGIVLTGKGWTRNQAHIREGFNGSDKDRQFERLFKLIEPKLYELDGPGGKKPPKPVGAKASQDLERSGIKPDVPQPKK